MYCAHIPWNSSRVYSKAVFLKVRFLKASWEMYNWNKYHQLRIKRDALDSKLNLLISKINEDDSLKRAIALTTFDMKL